MPALLLDSHIALWLVAASTRLSAVASSAINEPTNKVHVSVATIWELEAKATLGKLPLPVGMWQRLDDLGVAFMPIGRDHAHVAPRLPLHHRDPFDRMLVAQALVEGLTLVTVDQALAAYGVSILW